MYLRQGLKYNQNFGATPSDGAQCSHIDCNKLKLALSFAF